MQLLSTNAKFMFMEGLESNVKGLIFGQFNWKISMKNGDKNKRKQMERANISLNHRKNSSNMIEFTN